MLKTIFLSTAILFSTLSVSNAFTSHTMIPNEACTAENLLTKANAELRGFKGYQEETDLVVIQAVMKLLGSDLKPTKLGIMQDPNQSIFLIAADDKLCVPAFWVMDPHEAQEFFLKVTKLITIS